MENNIVLKDRSYLLCAADGVLCRLLMFRLVWIITIVPFGRDFGRLIDEAHDLFFRRVARRRRGGRKAAVTERGARAGSHATRVTLVEYKNT